MCLESHEKSDRIRPGEPVPFWLSAGRGWILRDANDHFLGIARIPAIMLTAVDMSVNCHTVLTFIEKIKIDAFSNLCNTEQNSEVAQYS